MRRMRHMTMPVLFRELAQLASQRSTYVVRGLCVAVFYIIGFLVLQEVFRSFHRQHDIRRVLGQGKNVLMGLTHVVQVAIYLMLPAMVVGSITTERENGTLDLMLVTRLSPWEIVLQKLFARLVPMMVLLSLTAPFMAVAYSLGGVSVGTIVLTLVGWLMCSLKIASMALLCSTVCKNTVGAFFVTYGLLLGMSIVLPIMMMLAAEFLGPSILRFAQLFSFLPASTFRGGGPGTMLAITIQILGVIPVLACLTVARFVIVRPRRSGVGGIKNTYHRIDGLMARMSRRPARGRVRSVKQSLPGSKPIAWREQAAAVVCNPTHLVRTLLVINIPGILILLAIISQTLMGQSGSREVEGLSAYIGILWIPVALATCIYVANLMSKERANQSLEVLLTTPLTEADILKQKLAAVPRICFVLSTPILVAIATETIIEIAAPRANIGHVLGYVVCSLLFMCIYFYALTWITFACSLKRRKRAQVVTMAVARAFAFIAIPALLMVLLQASMFSWLPRDIRQGESLLMMSPLALLGILEFDKNEFFDHAHAIVANGVFYMGVALLLRFRAMRWARLHLCDG